MKSIVKEKAEQALQKTWKDTNLEEQKDGRTFKGSLRSDEKPAPLPFNKIYEAEAVPDDWENE